MKCPPPKKKRKKERKKDMSGFLFKSPVFAPSDKTQTTFLATVDMESQVGALKLPGKAKLDALRVPFLKLTLQAKRNGVAPISQKSAC